MVLKKCKTLTILILTFFIRLILFSCIFITAWQAWKCVVKYQENPQSTSSSMECNGNLPFPAITICSQLDSFRKNYLEDIPYNKTKLKDCGLTYELEIFVNQNYITKVFSSKVPKIFMFAKIF